MSRFRVRPMVKPVQLAVNALLLALCAHALWAAVLIPCRNRTPEDVAGANSRGVVLLNGVGDTRYGEKLRNYLIRHDPAETSAAATSGYNSLLPEVFRYGEPAAPVIVRGENEAPQRQPFQPFALNDRPQTAALPPQEQELAAFPAVQYPQLRDDEGRVLDCSRWDPVPECGAAGSTLLAVTLTNGMLRGEVVASCGDPQLDRFALVQTLNHTRPTKAGIITVSWPAARKEK